MSSTSSAGNPWKPHSSYATGTGVFSDPSLKAYCMSEDKEESVRSTPALPALPMTAERIGASFFNSVAASTIIRNYRITNDPTMLELKLMATMRDFPYHLCAKSLVDHEQGRHGSQGSSTYDGPAGDGRSELFTSIGNLLITGSEHSECYLATKVKAFLPRAERYKMADDFSRPLSPPQSSSSRGSSPAVRVDAHCGRQMYDEQLGRSRSRSSDQFGLGIYMTKLQERCDQKGWHSVIQYQQLGYHQSWWKATLLVQGRTYEKEAKSKKEARFQACKLACEDLRIS